MALSDEQSREESTYMTALLHAYCKTLNLFRQCTISEDFRCCAISLVTGKCCSRLDVYSCALSNLTRNPLIKSTLRIWTLNRCGSDFRYQEYLTASESII
jgi:hypothetical protein